MKPSPLSAILTNSRDENREEFIEKLKKVEEEVLEQILSITSYSNSCFSCFNWFTICSIYKILYLDFLLIITSTGASYVFLEKILEVADLSIDTWKTRYIEYKNSSKWRINNSVVATTSHKDQ